ncbi:MAG: AI-2E family transporter [Deltaproteobacteria bacterium]|nr:AI-2E family transporter [Deltaproteobacteria bacterium]
MGNAASLPPPPLPGPLVGRLLFLAAALVIVIAGLRAAASLCVPLVFALFLAILSSPALRLFRRRRWPMALAVLIVVVADLAVLAGVLSLLVTSVGDLRTALPTYSERSVELVNNTVAWLAGRGVKVNAPTFEQMLEPDVLMGPLLGVLQGLASAISDLVLVLLIMVFMLVEATGFPQKVLRAFSTPEMYLARFATIALEVQRYLGYKTLINAAAGVFLGLAYGWLGVDFALLWGIAAFLLNYVPTVGPLLAAIPPVVLALLMLGPSRALAVLAVTVAFNTVLFNMVEPLVMGRRLGLSPAVVFLSLLVWGWIWGPVGMLLSVPLTMIVKIALETSPTYGWIAVMLSPAPKELRARAKSVLAEPGAGEKRAS